MTTVRPLFDKLQAITFRGKQLVTLADFAARHSVDPVSVSRWKNGSRDLPTPVLVDLVAILKAAKVKFDLTGIMLDGYERADAGDWLARLRREAKDKTKTKKETKHGSNGRAG